MSVYPKRSFPLGTIFTTIVCLAVAVLAVVFHHFPQSLGEVLEKAGAYIVALNGALVEYLYNFVPENVLALLASKSPAAAVGSAAQTPAAPLRT